MYSVETCANIYTHGELFAQIYFGVRIKVIQYNILSIKLCTYTYTTYAGINLNFRAYAEYIQYRI